MSASTTSSDHWVLLPAPARGVVAEVGAETSDESDEDAVVTAALARADRILKRDLSRPYVVRGLKRAGRAAIRAAPPLAAAAVYAVRRVPPAVLARAAVRAARHTVAPLDWRISLAVSAASAALTALSARQAARAYYTGAW